MINEICISSVIESQNIDSTFIKLPFYKDNKPFDFEKICWGLTLLSAGSMRFRWNEENLNRDKILSEIAKDKIVIPLELIHSKIVYDVKSKNQTQNKTGDGIITANPKYVPIITVADCVPIYFYEPKSCVFGVVHSGWKGTGIIQNAIELACKNYNLIPKDFLVAIGPHINDCCYKISQDRAEFFLQNYGCNSVINRNNELFLSLTEANLFILEKIGINKNNIVVTTDCTCCEKFSVQDRNVFGSFRREAAFLPNVIDNQTKLKSMTVQGAFVIYK